MRKGLIAVILATPLMACAFVTQWFSPTALPPTLTVLPTVTQTRTIEPTSILQPTDEPDPSPTLTPTYAPTPTGNVVYFNAQQAALRSAFAKDVEQFPYATWYWIEVGVEFSPQEQKATLEGVARIHFTNSTDESLSNLVLMLWPNESQYRSEMEAGPVILNGQPIEPRIELNGIALRFELPQPLEPNQSLDLSLPFIVQASGPIGGTVPRRFGITEGVLVAPTFYPLIPRWVNGAWQVEKPAPGGDTTNSDTAFYRVEITAPSEYTIVASGEEIEHRQTGEETQTRIFVTGPMRDFAFALGPFEHLVQSPEQVDIHAWFLPQHRESANTMLRAAVEQFESLNERVGSYPYTELDLVDAPGAFGGIEYPGLVFIGTVGGPDVILPTVHEVAHQWFYGLIGDDQLHEPWLDEALASYCEVLYYEEEYGTGRASRYLSDIRTWVQSHPDPTIPIGMGIGEYASPQDYYLFVYGKGKLFLDALRNRLGDRAFFNFLQDYFLTYRYQFVTAENFQAIAEETCQCDLDGLFDLWVYQGGEMPVP